MTDEGIAAAEGARVSARFPDLAGKAAIVTGASRGIGKGMAQFFGRQGMRLVLGARSEDKGLAVRDALRGEGVTCEWVTADVGTAEGARAIFDAALAAYGRIDLLVNNAAQLASRPFLELDEAWYEDSFERNVRVVYELSLLTARHWVAARQPGVIIHVSSVGGLRAHRGLAGYDAAKGAVDALTRSMAIELAPHGIRVNAVAPGATPPPGRVVPPERRAACERAREGIPLKRFGTPEDIAAAVAFLASDAGAYITGQVIYVDGGLTTQLTPEGLQI